MDEHAIVRSMLLRTAGGVPATAPLAKAVLEWAQPHADWLVTGHEGELSREALLAGLAESRTASTRPPALDLADALADLLALPPLRAAAARTR